MFFESLSKRFIVELREGKGGRDPAAFLYLPEEVVRHKIGAVAADGDLEEGLVCPRLKGGG